MSGMKVFGKMKAGAFKLPGVATNSWLFMFQPDVPLKSKKKKKADETGCSHGKAAWSGESF